MTDVPGFELSRKFDDQKFIDVLNKHGLPENASLAQVEEKATELLGSPLTFIEGTSLVIGRRIDAKETEILGPVLMSGRSGRDRFGAALLVLAIEDIKVRK